MPSISRITDSTAIVIGAGASGLAAAQALQARGISVRILDKAHRAGEAWHHRHPQLRLNTHRYLSHLPGMKIPKEAGAFPSRDSIIGYLENYAAHLDLPIEFGVDVKRIERVDAEWVIKTDACIYTTRHVVIATGYDHVPYIPDWPGRADFERKLIHSADFGDLAQYEDKKVLVIGAGNSGTDILNHLSGIETEKCWVSLRHGPTIFPTRLYGFPVQLSSLLMSKVPTRVVDKALALTEFIAFGNLSKWGLHKHPHGAATRLKQTGISPAIDKGFIAALKAGNTKVVPEVRAFETGSVILSNGQRIEPDIVIAATGYRTGLESMIGHLGVLDRFEVPTIHGAVLRSDYPGGMYFTGMRPGLTGFFHAAGEVGKEIANAVDASQLPRDIETSNSKQVRVRTWDSYRPPWFFGLR